MDQMNCHLTANLTLTCVFWAIILVGIWVFLPVGVILRVVISVVGIAVAGYIGHWIFPRITGPIIEKVYEAKHQ
jgi:hypothetical protein